MKPDAAAFAEMSDPRRNWHFSRRWTDEQSASVDEVATGPIPKTLEDLSVELLIDFRRGRPDS
jgi:hypothetical protein